MRENKSEWFSIPGISIVLIFLNGILPLELIVTIQFFLILLMLKRVRIPYSFLIVFALVLLQGIICIMNGNDTVSLFLKQYISILISVIFWLLCTNITSIQKLLIMYKQLSLLTSFVAIFQFIASLVGLNVLANMAWLIKSQSSTPLGRSAAFLNEPSACALVLFPMTFLSLYLYIGKYKYKLKLKISNWQRITIILGFIATGSSSGFIGVTIGLVLMALEYGLNYKEFIILIVGFLILGGIYKSVPLIKERMDDTYSLLRGKQSLSSVNVSTQTFILNKDVAMDSFKETKGFGGGLGSHQISYSKYISAYSEPNLIYLNQQDANSMLLRIISEMGILGLLIAFCFLWFCRYRKEDKKDLNFKVISLMCLSYILMRFTRFGHYFDSGFFMFVAIYYKCYEISKKG